MDPKTIIKQFILNDIQKDRKRKDLADGESLIDQGVIDSLGIMKMLAFLEEKFNIQIAGDELVLENFETLDAITQLVDKKIASI
jgi:acyl carrier protein